SDTSIKSERTATHVPGPRVRSRTSAPPPRRGRSLCRCATRRTGLCTPAPEARSTISLSLTGLGAGDRHFTAGAESGRCDRPEPFHVSEVPGTPRRVTVRTEGKGEQV